MPATGIPGTNCSASETSAAPIWLISAVLGLTRSDDASSSCDTTRDTSGPPNIASPLSTADRVASYVMVASASPDAATEITTTQRLRKRARNSRIANSDRYVSAAVVAGTVRSCRPNAPAHNDSQGRETSGGGLPTAESGWEAIWGRAG